MSLTILTLTKNEGGRWLPSLLAAWQQLARATRIIALDDGSTDDTVAVLERAGASVTRRGATDAAWGAESSARCELYGLAQAAAAADWYLWLDADMVPARRIDDLLAIASSLEADAIAFRLYDLWMQHENGSLYYRHDAYWQAHQVPRVWCISAAALRRGGAWSDRGIHCGHLPQGLQLMRAVVAPREYSMLHYGYLHDADKAAKAAAYASQLHQLSPQEAAHAASIAQSAALAPLDIDVAWSVTYGG